MQKYTNPPLSEMNSNFWKNSFLVWGTIILIYILLFEFLLPVNNILPKPSLLYDSLISLQKDYSLFLNFTYSVSGVYISIIAAFLILKLMNGIFREVLIKFSGLKIVFRIVKYFPLIGFIVLFVFWFPYSSISEYLICFTISLFFLLHVFKRNIRNIKKEYFEPLIISAVNKKEVINQISWKSSEPYIFHSLKKLQIYLWTIILFFEFVKGVYGIGNIYRNALMYQDLAALFTLSILLMIILYLGDIMINFTGNKFFEWES